MTEHGAFAAKLRLHPVRQISQHQMDGIGEAWTLAGMYSEFLSSLANSLALAMVAVAYIDPGNYSTDVAAGAATRFKLLFIVLLSNIIAILLQCLAVRLGTVTGLNLAEHCRAHLPRWLNIILYILGEAAIIATDIAEVRGFSPARLMLSTNRSKGHWLSDSSESLTTYPSSSGLRHYASRRSYNPNLLQSRWLNAPSTSL